MFFASNHLLLLGLLGLLGASAVDSSAPSDEIIDDFARSLHEIQLSLKDQRLQLEQELINVQFKDSHDLEHVGFPFIDSEKLEEMEKHMHTDCFPIFRRQLQDIAALGKKVGNDSKTIRDFGTAHTAYQLGQPKTPYAAKVERQLQEILKRGIVTPEESVNHKKEAYQQKTILNYPMGGGIKWTPYQDPYQRTYQKPIWAYNLNEIYAYGRRYY